MLRRLFIVLFVIGLIGGLFCFILESPAFLQWLIPQVVQQRWPQYHITNLTIAEQKFSWPGTLVWKNIQCKIKTSSVTYMATLQELDAAGLETILQQQGVVIIDVATAQLKSKQINIEGLNGSTQIQLHNHRISQFNGSVRSATASYEPYRLKHFSVNFTGDAQKIVSQRFSAQAYDGILTGAVTVTYQPDVIYSVYLKLRDLNIDSLQETKSPVFEQVGGKITGVIHVKGNPTSLLSLKTDLDLTQGGKIKASLLSFLLQYLPQSVQRKQLEALIQGDGMVDLEIGKLELKSLNQTALSGIMSLSSKQLNLNINIPMDIHMDGKLQSLLEQWTAFLPHE